MECGEHITFLKGDKAGASPVSVRILTIDGAIAFSSWETVLVGVATGCFEVVGSFGRKQPTAAPTRRTRTTTVITRSLIISACVPQSDKWCSEEM